MLAVLVLGVAEAKAAPAERLAAERAAITHARQLESGGSQLGVAWRRLRLAPTRACRTIRLARSGAV